MAFTVSGTVHGIPVAVTWRSGKLEGASRDLEIAQCTSLSPS